MHLTQFPTTPRSWRDEALEHTWEQVWRVRSVITGALERERAQKRIGSSLEAAPAVHVADRALRAALDGIDLAEIAITSAAELISGEGPADAFRLPRNCRRCGGAASGAGPHARSWKISEEESAAIPSSRMSRRAMPRRCASGWRHSRSRRHDEAAAALGQALLDRACLCSADLRLRSGTRSSCCTASGSPSDNRSR